MQKLTFELLDRLIEVAQIKIAAEDFNTDYAYGYICAVIDTHQVNGKCDEAGDMYIYVKNKLEVE